MAPPRKNIDYNSPNFQFPAPEDSSTLYKKGLLSKELLPIKENSERLVDFNKISTINNS